MVKTLLGFLFLLSCLALPASARPLYDNPGTNAAAQDAEGTVWALADNGTAALKRWFTTTAGRTGAWKIETIPGTEGFQALCLTRGTDSAVYAFWQMFSPGQSETPCLITVHRGGEWHIMARFSEAALQQVGWPFPPILWADADGSLWLAGDRPLLRHISPAGVVTPFPLTPEQSYNQAQPGNFPPNQFHSVTDGNGRRWFWETGWNPAWQPTQLPGVLIWDGKSLAYHPTLSGVPNRPFSALAPLDANQLWLAAIGRLYRLDTRTLSAAVETPPLPGAFQNIVQIFQASGDWYAVDQGQNGQTATLWRKRAGQWQKCLDKIEEIGGYYRPGLPHPWLAEPNGLWLGVQGGAWWLPRTHQPPLWVNWRRGLTLSDSSSFFPLADGSILAISSSPTAQIPSTPQPIRPLPPSIAIDGLGAPPHLGSLLSDPKQHLWGTRTTYSQPCPLDEWDGKRWRTHLPPKSILGINSLYACDTLGRIWLNTSNWNPPAQPQPINGFAVYDPAHDTWTNYATVPEAFHASAMLPNMAFRPYRNTPQLPVFSGDGRITYTNGGTTIYFYDGHAWRQWEAREILPSYAYGNLGSIPHFNSSGHLEVALNGDFWEWVSPAGWQQAGKQILERDEASVPPGGPAGMWVPPVVDSLGRKWFHWQRKVFTAWHGLWAEQPELSAFGSPFADDHTLEDMLTDSKGRLFFLTRSAGDYELIVWTPPHVPKPTLFIVPTGDDSVTIHLPSKLPRSSWYLWRLNNGPWSAPQKTQTLIFTTLPRGDYRVEVQTLDRRLQVSPTAVAVFSIRVAPKTQIARWVSALLHGTDDQREIAVAGLVKQPDAALPALQAVRSSASEAARWWIEAAIQQIEEARDIEGRK